MKAYKNYLFDLYGTLVDIHTNEESPAFWKNVSRLLGMQGVDRSPQELKERYQKEIARQESLLRARLPEGAEPEVDLALVFRSFFEDTGAAVDDRGVADFARTFRLLSIRRLKLFPGVLGMLEYLHRQGKNVYLLSNAQALFTRPELTLLGRGQSRAGQLLCQYRPVPGAAESPAGKLHRAVQNRRFDLHCIKKEQLLWNPFPAW